MLKKRIPKSNQYEEKQMTIYYYDATREHSDLSRIIGDDYSGVSDPPRISPNGL